VLLAKGASKEQQTKQQITKEWKDFHLKMECPLFHTSAIVDGLNSLLALIDSGAQSYASINEKLARKLSLPLLETTPRMVTGVFEGPMVIVDKATYFSLDVGGFKQQRIFAYVVPNQGEELILGRPWLKDNNAVLNEGRTARKTYLRFQGYSGKIWSNKVLEASGQAPQITRIAGTAFHSLTKGKSVAGLQIFAASLADIEKALKPKPKPSREDVRKLLPKEYAQFLDTFDPAEASKLPPHREGVDLDIPLEKDDNGRDKEVPWGPLYSMSRQELLVLRKELTSLLDKDFIQASKSSAGAPVLFAKKPGGGLRFCIDYRGLNAILKKDRYPLPLIRETLAALGKAKWLTKLDVSAAFHRIRVAKGEEWKTAFRTRYGLFEWKVCPFGISNAPSTFQRYINWTLRDYLDDFCSAYIDDVLIFSSGSLEDHQEKVKSVLQRLTNAGLHLDIKKCEFETQTTKYLGYIIDVGNGVRMDPEKTRAIREWQAPQTVKGVRSFLGFANYYRLFIKDYSSIAKPLNDLTKKGTAFQWTTAANNAFEQLKALFQDNIVLASYDPDRETRVEPDASGWAVGGVLTQKDQVLGWRPVAFFSTRHAPAECNYDIHDKELLAIVKCIKEWNSELRGLTKPFLILTDHKNLEPFTVKKRLNERQVRWAELLSEFNFKLEHRPGKEATIPDALSRREQDVPQGEDDSRLAERDQTVLPEQLWISRTGISLPNPFTDDKELADAWNASIDNDEVGAAYNKAREAVVQGQRTFPKDLNLKMAIGECKVSNELLYYRDRVWLPQHEPLTTRVIQKVHDSYLGGHPGRDATISLLSRQFYWVGMNADTRRFLRNCHVCGRTTVWRDKKKGLLKPLPIPSRIWSEISLDFITGLVPSAKNSSTVMLVITDRFSKGSMLLEVKEDEWDAEGFAGLFIERYCPIHWIPRAITSDRGVQFVNNFWKRLCELLKIERRLSTAYHPETDGATERRNQEVEAYLRSFVAYNQRDWGTLLPMAQIALDNRPAASTGISPFFLSHGWHPETISLPDNVQHQDENQDPTTRAEVAARKMQDARDFAEAALASAQQSQEYYANQSRSVPASFKEGDKVWLNLKNISTDRPTKKLDWVHAQYTVTRTFPGSSHFYELNVPTGIHKKFHVSLLRPAATDPLPTQEQDDPQPPAIIAEDGEEEYGIEKVLYCCSQRQGRGYRRFAYVKWKGYAQPSFTLLENLQDTAALDNFERTYGDAKTNDGPRKDYVYKEPPRPTTRRKRRRRGIMSEAEALL
jgi:transposase InsO family protein/predicted aspartyl protease